MDARVERWRAAWESRDVERVLALYEPTASHASPLVPRLSPEVGGAVLVGSDQIRTYVGRGLARFAWLRFDVLSVTSEGERTAVEYRRQSDVDASAPAHVLELIEWRGDRIRAVRVFHF
jgi:hypothetical protein